MSVRTKLYALCDREGLYNLEGARGVRNFTKIVNVLGYESMTDFLEDNPGALEAMFEWLCDTNLVDWEESLDAELEG